MCELTYVNTRRADLNKQIVFNQALENTRRDNQHGWGIFTTESGIFKTKTIPWETPKFGIRVRNLVTEEPTILHVRSASRGTDVKIEFNHPFESEHLILAHNGTLTPTVVKPEYAEKLDSEVFLMELEETYRKEKKSEKRLVTSLQETMLKFSGKFAFLIYEKETKNWYAVRGKTADLHIIYILNPKDPAEEKEILGYVINTVKVDLRTATDSAIELLHMLGKPNIPLVSEVVELAEESIFLLGPTIIEKIGELKQNYPVVVSTPATRTAWVGHGYAGRGAWGVGMMGDDWDDLEDVEPFKEVESATAFLASWLRTYGLQIEDLDQIFVQTLGVTLLASTKSDYDTFKKYVHPKLICSKLFREEVMAKIQKFGSYWMPKVYEKGPFQFPYMLEKDQRKFLATMDEEITSILSARELAAANKKKG